MFTGGRLSDKPLRVVAACIIALTLSLFVVSPTTAFAAEGSETSSQNPIESFFSSVASFFGANDSNQLAAGDESTQVDESTIDSWQTFLTDQQGNVSTENIGRIWTDKSVFDGNVTLKNTEPETGGQQQITVNLNQGDGSDSSFLVGLSALATASNTTTYTSQPLDIVLVLDMSSSMDQSMGGSRYIPRFTSRTSTRARHTTSKKEAGSVQTTRKLPGTIPSSNGATTAVAAGAASAGTR